MRVFAGSGWSSPGGDFFWVGLKYAAIKDKLDLGADYSHSRSRGEISVVTGAAAQPLPAVTTTPYSIKLYAICRLKDDLSLQLSLWHDRFDSKNSMLDAVAPNTIPNVLTFGEQAPRYSLNAIRVALRYKFERTFVACTGAQVHRCARALWQSCARRTLPLTLRVEALSKRFFREVL